MGWRVVESMDCKTFPVKVTRAEGLSADIVACGPGRALVSLILPVERTAQNVTYRVNTVMVFEYLDIEYTLSGETPLHTCRYTCAMACGIEAAVEVQTRACGAVLHHDIAHAHSILRLKCVMGGMMHV